MRHDWEMHICPPGKTPAQCFVDEPYRRCRNCGVIQQQERETWWGRTLSRKWRPLAGRCKPKEAVQ